MKVKFFIIIICVVIAICLLSLQYSAWEESLSANVSIEIKAKKRDVIPIIQPDNPPVISSLAINPPVLEGNTLPLPNEAANRPGGGESPAETLVDAGTPPQEINGTLQGNDGVPQIGNGEQQTDITENNGDAAGGAEDTQEESEEPEETDVQEENTEAQELGNGAQPADEETGDGSTPQGSTGEQQADAGESNVDTQGEAADTVGADLQSGTEAVSSGEQ